MENQTARNFVLQLGSLISLYLSLAFLLVLIFGLINLLFPDAVDSVWQVESASSSVRIGFAMVLVFFPTYLVLTRLVNKARRQNTQGNYLSLTKWLIYLSLLVGGLVLLGDLVAVIMNFLEGELTQRFILKAITVLVVVGAAFHYYLLDARGYWLKNEQKSIMFGIGASILVLVALAYGIANIQTPSEVREQKLDQTQIQHLQEIQWRIQDYLTLNNRLPETIDDVYNIKGIPAPTAPENRPAYKYNLTDQGFELCATFMTTSRADEYLYYERPITPAASEFPTIINKDNWQHSAGEVCFKRIVSIN